MYALRQRRDGQVGVEVIDHPRLQLPEGLALRSLRGELRRELGLAAGTLHEQDELAGDLEGEARPMVLLDEGQREVHARGDASRRPHVAVVHEDRIVEDLDGRERPAEGVAPRPVGGRPAAVEEASPREQEGARAHGRNAAGSPRGAPDERHELLVRECRPRAGAARDDQRVDRSADGREPCPSRDRVPRGRLDRVAALGDDLYAIAGVAGLVGGGEHLRRPGHVQRLDAREGHDHDPAVGGHCNGMISVRWLTEKTPTGRIQP